MSIILPGYYVSVVNTVYMYIYTYDPAKCIAVGADVWLSD